MKVLVTGASGLLGSHVVQELIKRNYQVRVLVRPESNLAALDASEVEVVVGQLTVREDVEQAITGCTHVIHTAARAMHTPTKLDAFRKVNVDSTRYVADACRKAKIKRLVYVSTANCFPNGSKSHPGTESGEFPSWLKKSGYAYSKLQAQQLVIEQVRKGMLDAVVVNPTFIVGKDYKISGGKIFTFILNKSVAFHPLGGKNFVDAKAAATGVVSAMEKGRRGECYLLAGENLSYRQFFKIVVNHTRQKTWMIPVPCFLLRLAGRMGDFSEKVLGKPVQLTFVNARMLCLGNYYTPAKAVKELGLPVVPAKVTIENALTWFEKNKKLRF